MRSQFYQTFNPNGPDMLKKRLLTGLAAVAMLVPLAGCSLFTGTEAHAPAELTPVVPQVAINTVWHTNVGASVNGLLTPVLVDGALYAAGDQNLYRLDPATGQVLWKSSTGAKISAGVGADGLNEAVVTVDGVLHVFDKEGKETWKATLSTDAQEPPLVGMGKVIVKTSDARIMAFDATTGQRLWMHAAQVPPLTLRVFKGMAFAPAGILVGQANGRLLALGLDGKVVFDLTIANPSGITEVERLVDIVGRPWVDAELMCLSAFQGEAVCLNAHNAQTVWAQKVDAVSGVVGHGALMYVVDSKGTVHAYLRQNGKEIWHNNALTYRSVSTPQGIGPNIAVGDYEGVISVIDADTGHFIARTKLSGAISAPAVGYDNGAIFQTSTGELAFLKESPLKK